MDEPYPRAKSAPPIRLFSPHQDHPNINSTYIKTAANVYKFVSKVHIHREDRPKTALLAASAEGHRQPNCLSFADTVNRFRTTARVIQRLKERRKAIVDIKLSDRPTGRFLTEIPTRRFSNLELDNVLTRICRPTASFMAKVSDVQRRNKEDIYVPPAAGNITDVTCDEDRFKGDARLKERELNELTHRLSAPSPRLLSRRARAAKYASDR